MHDCKASEREVWRRRSESNRWIKVLQTSALPLGYAAIIVQTKGEGHSCRLLEFGLRLEPWSGRRDLNPRLRPWQGRTLPLSYSRSGFNYKQAALGLSAVANRYWCPAPPFSSVSLARAVI